MAAGQIFVGPHLNPTDDLRRAWDSAIGRFTARCAADVGIEGLPDLPIGLSSHEWDAKVPRFLSTNLEELEQYGYDLPPPADDSPSPVVSGSIPEGAVETCRGPVQHLFDVQIAKTGFDPAALNIDTELLGEFLGDRSLDPIRDKWVMCVADQGYPDPRSLKSPSEGSPAMAVADARCRKSSGYSVAKVAWFRVRVQKWLDENAETVRLSNEYWEGLVDSAIALI